jgi:hypothetical protein
MRLVAQIHVTVRGDVVRRDPSFFERLKRGMGGRVDLDTGELQNQLEATAVVDAVRRALGRMNVDNALSLVVDDAVIFQDAEGKTGDLPDLVLALADHSSVFGQSFRELRFAAEHEEAGLHLVVETRARTRHRRDEPAAVVSVGGRIRALEPQRGESAEAYRTRVDPLTRDATLFDSSRLAFESFVSRLRQALSAAMPDADIVEHRADARLVKQGTRELKAAEGTPLAPMHPAYDPFLVYYPPSPFGLMLDAMIFSSFVHMMMPPPMLVVSPLGVPIGSTTELDAVRDPDLADAHVSHHDADPEHAYHGAESENDQDSGDTADYDHGQEDFGSAWDDDLGGGDFDGDF